MFLITSFLAGLFAAIMALIGEISIISILTAYYQGSRVGQSVVQNTITSAIEITPLFLFLSAFIEELCKYASLRKLFSPEKKFFLVSLIFFGIGFSSLEMFLLYGKLTSFASSDMLYISGIAILHILSVLMLGLSLHMKNIRSYMIFIGSVLLHFMYNIAILHQSIFISTAILCSFFFASFILLIFKRYHLA